MACIIGDSAFSLQCCLITPFHSPSKESSEFKFNQIHLKITQYIHDTIAQLKTRFRCLANPNGIPYGPEKASQIINTCCALHNICKKFKVENPKRAKPYTCSKLNLECLKMSDDKDAIEIRNNILANIFKKNISK